MKPRQKLVDYRSFGGINYRFKPKPSKLHRS